MAKRAPAVLSIVLFSLAAACGQPADADRPSRRDAGARTKQGPPAKAPPVRQPLAPDAPVQVVVVGGGLAGLTAAHELEKRGITTHVLEATDLWGGRVATAYYEADLFGEYGMQEIWDGNPLLDIARELGVPLDGEPEEPFSSVEIDGVIHPFVQETSREYFASFLDAAERRALDRWMKKAKRLHDQAERQGLRAAGVRELQDISFATWIGRENLPHDAAEFVRLTIECELAADWEAFSAVVGLLEFGVFLGPGAPNYHVQGGNQRVIDALAERIRGGKTLSATVTRIEHRAGQRARVSYLKDHRLASIEADRVVVAVPFVRVHQILFDPPLSDDKWQAILTLNRGQYTVVHLLMDKEADRLWEVGGESPFPILSRGPLGVIYGVMEETPESQPLQVFSLLIYGVAASSFHMAPRDARVRQVLEELDRRWPGLSGHVRATHVYTYHPASIPIWPPGRSPIDDQARTLLEPETGVYLAGDYTWNAHSEGAVRSAMRAAERIAADLGSGPPRR